MDTSKIIKGVVSNGRYTVTASIVKEDYGLYLKIEGVELPSTYEVDFSNSENNGTSVTMIGNADGVLIPHQFIDTGKDIFAFLYHVGADFGRTVYKFRIPNKVRPDRTNEEPTPEEQSVIDQVIASLNDAVDRAEDAEQAIEDMSVSATTLAEGSTATVTKTESEGVVHLEFGIPRGATGEQGKRGLTGDDGISPIVTITPITGGHRITITDADGEHSADVMDGDDYTLTAQDKQDIAELVDVPVDDVQINGSSIVVDGVANVPTASASRLGVIKTSNENGIYVNSDGALSISEASSANVKNGTNVYKPITPHIEHEATFYGLAKSAGDTTQSASSNAVGIYTDDAKISIQKMLGLYKAPYRLIKTIEITEETGAIVIASDDNGESFELTDLIVTFDGLLATNTGIGAIVINANSVNASVPHLTIRDMYHQSTEQSRVAQLSVDGGVLIGQAMYSTYASYYTPVYVGQSKNASGVIPCDKIQSIAFASLNNFKLLSGTITVYGR